jgi:proline racemase
MGPDLPYVPLWIDTEDWHTAGEPFRVVEYLPAGHLPQGVTVAERRFNVLATPLHPLDTLRQTLSHEPRGHADMYGGFIVPSNDSGAQFGVLFWHKDGFSTACGHGTIALGYWAVAKGLVEVPQKDCEVDVVVDAPSGRVKASVAVQDGKLVHADFVNVASRKLTDTIQLAVPSYRIDAHLQLVTVEPCMCL